MAVNLKPSAGSDIRSDINVTPLVDVCLVLLVIFIVVTPLLTGVSVSLPKTSKEPLEKSDPLAVSIQEDGSVWVRDTRVADGELRETLAQIQAAEPDRTVVVRGDERLQYKRISQVLGILSEVGFDKVGLATDGQEPAPGKQ